MEDTPSPEARSSASHSAAADFAWQAAAAAAGSPAEAVSPPQAAHVPDSPPPRPDMPAMLPLPLDAASDGIAGACWSADICHATAIMASRRKFARTAPALTRCEERALHRVPRCI